jgi:hypothetical protein
VYRIMLESFANGVPGRCGLHDCNECSAGYNARIVRGAAPEVAS